jgi:hypothetical protein
LLGSRERLLRRLLRIFLEQDLEVVFGSLCGALLGRLLLFLFLLLLGVAVLEAGAAAGGRRQRNVAEAALGASDVAVIRAILDLATDAQPVLLERVVALDDVLELEALGGVADLRLAQRIDAAIDVLSGNRGLELLDADEILLVERAETLEPRLELRQRNVDVARWGRHALNRATASRAGCRNTREPASR